MEARDPKVQAWLEKAAAGRTSSLDLSKDEDRGLALMNLISLEEHFYFTAVKTNDQKYLDMLESVREVRKAVQTDFLQDPQGEEWCIAKHLMAASIRLMEVGTKELTAQNRAAAGRYFRYAFDLFSLCMALNMGAVEPGELKQELAASEENTLLSKFSQLVKKLVDCCIE